MVGTPAGQEGTIRKVLRRNVLLEPADVLLDLRKVRPEVVRRHHLEERREQIGCEDEGVANIVAIAAGEDNRLAGGPHAAIELVKDRLQRVANEPLVARRQEAARADRVARVGVALARGGRPAKRVEDKAVGEERVRELNDIERDGISRRLEGELTADVVVRQLARPL